MRENQPDLPRWPPRAAPNGSIKPLLEAQESSTQVQVLPAKRPQGQLSKLPGVSAHLRLLHQSTPTAAAATIPVCSLHRCPHNGWKLSHWRAPAPSPSPPLRQGLCGPLRCPRPHHIGPRPSVLLSTLGSTFSVPGYSTPPNHCLSPSGQQYGGKETLTALGHPQGPHWWCQLALPSPMGASGPPEAP